ncbi:uncharacterized protein LOC117177491 isoform X2 [Belonocnema kinseyi]|nr:uncharacterized protein LOC117177491 isoform X2 [Belonocnema kinseyi]
MMKIKLAKDEHCDSYSEADNSKSKSCSIKSGLSSPTNTRAILCEHNSVYLNTLANDNTGEESSESGCISKSLDSSHPITDTKKGVKLKDDFHQAPENLNTLDGIIKEIDKLRFGKDSPKIQMMILKSEKTTNSSGCIDNQKNGTSLTKDNAMKSNDSKKDYQMNIYIERQIDEVEERPNNFDLDNRLENQDDDDENLIARGPVRPHLCRIRNKSYDTLDWLFQSDGYSSREYYDGQQSETSDYETSIQQLMTDNDYRETIDSCLEQLSDSSKKTENYYAKANLETIQYEKNCSNQDLMSVSSSKTPPAIVVNNPEGASLLEILARGGFQAAHIFSDTETNGSSPRVSSEVWPDSPASSCNIVTSRPNSRSSSRGQSPGPTIMPINIAGSPPGSSQVPLNFRSCQGFSSSSSSNQSYCETPSPSNYQSPLDQRSEDQLYDGFNSFAYWQKNDESSSTIVGNNTAELIDAIDSNELRLVEEVVLKEMSKKGSASEEMQVVPNSQLDYRGFESLESVQSLLCPTDKHSRCSLDTNQITRSERTNVRARTDMNFFTESLNFANTGSIINEAQQSLVYPKTSDGFDLVYSENVSPGSCCRGKVSTTRSYIENTSPPNNDIGKSSSASLEIDATIETILANKQATNNSINDASFDMDLFDCAKSTCTTYSGSSNVHSGRTSVSEQPTTSTFNDFQIPEILSKHSRHHIPLWSSLNLPSTKACDKLIKELNPKEVEKAMKSLLKKSKEELAKADEDGDTMLMCLVGNPDELRKKKAYLPPLVERLSTVEGALSAINNRGEDALYLMAMNCPQMAYITGYLAATMLQKGIHVGQKLYQPRGDTLIHAVAAKGDSHKAVLAELLALKTVQGNPGFNVSTRNYEGKTALHVAVESHDPINRGRKSIATVQLLLEHGADLTIKETIRGNTALHAAVFISCDPVLVKVLLARNSQDIINIGNYHGNTSLHMAMMCNGVNLERQMEVCKILVENGAKISIANGSSRTPLEFVHPDRKDTLRTIFHRRSKIH